MDDQEQIPAAKAPAKTSKVKQEIFVLEKNFGAIIGGVHRFWEKGTEFIKEEESELVSFFHRTGAPIVLKK
ncbi:MAG: hypothetical protein KGL39_11055 [Patescibacteria group bacterium]|nr:hypothetical protein [Patescibacteria group bacterium]